MKKLLCSGLLSIALLFTMNAYAHCGKCAEDACEHCACKMAKPCEKKLTCENCKKECTCGKKCECGKKCHCSKKCTCNKECTCHKSKCPCIKRHCCDKNGKIEKKDIKKEIKE